MLFNVVWQIAADASIQTAAQTIIKSAFYLQLVTARVAKGREISMGTSSGEFWKYPKFETYQ